MIVLNKVMKAFLYDRYGIKVKSIGLGQKFCTKSHHYDSQGGSYEYTDEYDEFGDVLCNRMFNTISDILEAIKSSKDYKGDK